MLTRNGQLVPVEVGEPEHELVVARHDLLSHLLPDQRIGHGHAANGLIREAEVLLEDVDRLGEPRLDPLLTGLKLVSLENTSVSHEIEALQKHPLQHDELQLGSLGLERENISRDKGKAIPRVLELHDHLLDARLVVCHTHEEAVKKRMQTDQLGSLLELLGGEGVTGGHLDMVEAEDPLQAAVDPALEL